jgi:transposase-like protein
MHEPQGRGGTFEPQIVKKRQRRLTSADEMVLSLYAKGLTTGEISAHFAEIHGPRTLPHTPGGLSVVRLCRTFGGDGA